jgi:hypothetical protein
MGNVLAGNDAIRFDCILSSNPYTAIVNTLGGTSIQNVAGARLPFSSPGGQADTRSLTKHNGVFVYQFGKINLVVNRLPNSFSVPSLSHSLSDAR